MHLQARASRDEIVGFQGDALRARVKAPPVEGRANAALTELLANALGVPRTNVAIVLGHTAREKLVAIHGLSVDEVRQRLGG